MTDPRQLFDGPAPTREDYVLGQGFRFRPATWQGYLAPEQWPPQLDELLMDDPHRRIDRRHVFSLAENVDTPAAAIHLYVAACVWGTGPGGWVERRTRPLRATPDAGQRLLEAIDVLRSEGAVAAYSRLSRGGESNVKWLGPAFFTKVLYFAGFDRTPDEQPLILDRFVAKALGWRTTGWTATEYGTYLDTAARWARECATTPDVVERALFEQGKRQSGLT